MRNSQIVLFKQIRLSFIFIRGKDEVVGDDGKLVQDEVVRGKRGDEEGAWRILKRVEVRSCRT